MDKIFLNSKSMKNCQTLKVKLSKYGHISQALTSGLLQAVSIS